MRAQLLVYATEQLAHIQLGRQAVQLQAIEQAEPDPPESAPAILRSTAQRAFQRLLHLLHGSCHIFLAHPFQESLLILAAQHFSRASFPPPWIGRFNTCAGNCTSRLG